MVQLAGGEGRLIRQEILSESLIVAGFRRWNEKGQGLHYLR